MHHLCRMQRVGASFKEACSHPGREAGHSPVHFMGLFDTVGALGIPKLNPSQGRVHYELYDTYVSRDVKYVHQVRWGWGL